MDMAVFMPSARKTIQATTTHRKVSSQPSTRAMRPGVALRRTLAFQRWLIIRNAPCIAPQTT
ncbi:hypothetical protein D9M69_505700 [compost metagenome]